MSDQNWHIEKEFLCDRLGLIARTIGSVRSNALEGHEPDLGDNSWVFGSRCYTRQCFALSQLAAKEEQRAWLAVLASGNSFTLLIKGIPMKFYASEEECLSDRELRKMKLMACETVKRQQEFSYHKDAKDADSAREWNWLIRVERHEDGTASRIVFFQADSSGETRYPYSVYMDEDVPVAAAVDNIRREAVDVPSPKVGPRKSAEVEKSDEK